ALAREVLGELAPARKGVPRPLPRPGAPAQVRARAEEGNDPAVDEGAGDRETLLFEVGRERGWSRRWTLGRSHLPSSCRRPDRDWIQARSPFGFKALTLAGTDFFPGETPTSGDDRLRGRLRPSPCADEEQLRGARPV